MSDELRAAAERVRRVEAGEPADQAYRAHPRRQFQQFADRGLMASAWLAEHPADDDEPISPEWLRSVGFTLTDAHVRYYSNRSRPPFVVVIASDGRLRLAVQNGSDVEGGDVCQKPTRGDVRRLCRALGIKPIN